MELKEALLKRRSVRKFTDEPVSKEHIDELMHAAMSGPSACNKKPWEFYVVTNETVLNDLKSASRFTKISAKLAIVVCGDLAKALQETQSGTIVDFQDKEATRREIDRLYAGFCKGDTADEEKPLSDAVMKYSREYLTGEMTKLF